MGLLEDRGWREGERIASHQMKPGINISFHPGLLPELLSRIYSK
jgi:hypothetical protein